MPNIREYGEFFKLWIKTAFTNFISQIDLWSSLSGAMLLFTSHFLQNGDKVMSSYAWQILPWACVMVVAVRLILSPYWIWKKNQQTITQKEAEITKRQNEIEELKINIQKFKNPLADRIPLTDIKKLVVDKGWKTIDNPNISQADNFAYDFTSKMMQAVKDGELRIWGNKHGKPLDNTLDEISKEHFMEGFIIDYGWLRYDVENTKTQTTKLLVKMVNGPSREQMGYKNLNVSKTQIENLLERWVPSQ